MKRTAKLAIALAVVATMAQAQAVVTGFPGIALFAAGTAAAPSMGWLADADGTGTGWYRSAADTMTLAINGVQRFTFAGVTLTIGGTGGNVSINSDTTWTRNGSGGSHAFSGGTTPTQSASTCGTGPTITGNNTKGCVTLGTGPTLPCTIVFNGTLTAAPAVFLNPEVLTTATTTVRATGITTSQFVITSSASLVATDKVCWWAPGP